jgi:hypothetical protein
MVDRFIEAGRLGTVRPRLRTLNDAEPNRFRCVNFVVDRAPDRDGAACSAAGGRKPPKEETAMGGT